MISNTIDTTNMVIESLKRENEKLKEENNFYKNYTKVLLESDENTIYNDLKVLFDAYAFGDKLSSDAYEIKNQLLFFTIYLVDKLKNDMFYGPIIMHMLSKSVFFNDKLSDYKELGKTIQDVINLDNHKLLKNIIEGENND